MNKTKFTWVGLFFVCFVLLFTVSAYASDDVIGDVNGDGKITALDCAILNAYSLGKITLSEVTVEKFDFNGDGAITSDDAKYMLGTALAHTPVFDDAVAATCTEAGLTAGMHCSTCGKILVEQVPVDACGHVYGDDACARCNETLTYANFTITDRNRSKIGYTGAEGENLDIPAFFQDTDGTWYKVTAIGDIAFSDCTKLTSVTIPDSVTSIGDWAFFGCSGLTGDLVVPDSVTSIGNQAFRACSGLTSLDLGSVSFIGDSAFSYCSGLTSLDLGSVTSIGGWAFRGCSGLTSLDLGSVISIGKQAFYGCSGLTGELVIPDSVTSIGDSAFHSCSGLTGELVIPVSVTSIGDHVFDGCSGLTSLDLGSVISIGDSAFHSCSGLTGRLMIPDYVTSIDGRAFVGCSGLTSLDLGSVTSIGEVAFYGCSGLTNVTIPDSVTSIGDSAFLGCLGLTDVYYAGTEEQWAAISIGSSNTPLTNATIHFNGGSEPTHTEVIDEAVAPTCTKTGLTEGKHCSVCNEVLVAQTVVDALGHNYVEGACTICGEVEPTTYVDFTVTADNRDKIGYTGAEGENLVIPATFQDADGAWYKVTSIGEYAFYGCSGLTSLDLGSVTSIGFGAFFGCSGLTSIAVDINNTVYHSSGDCIIETASNTLVLGCKNSVIPNYVTSIGDHAFRDCSGLTGELVIPDSVTSIGDSAFSGCSGLTSVTIPDSVTSIGGSAFYDCSGLTSVTIPDSVTSIGDSAFRGCSGLTGELVIPDSVTSIGDSAFYSCSGLNGELVIPDSVTSIGNRAFRGCSGLTSVTIPDSVTSIGDSAFSGCSGLTSVTIPDSVTSIGGSAFYDCSGLTSVTIPDSVTSIGDSAFRGCSGLNGELVIPDSVTSIGYGAFYNCSGLTGLDLGNGVLTIGAQAFYYCSGLTGELVIPDSVTSIGGSAFGSCSALTSLDLGSGVQTIGGSAFYWCSRLTGELVIPDSVTSIGTWAFSNCSRLTSLDLGSGVQTIGGMAFWYCSGLTGELVIPDSVTSIGKNAFLGCSGLTGELVIPDSVTSIGDSAFSGCSGLTSVTIPDSVTSIGGSAFYDCSGLTSVTIPDSVTSIGGSAFRGCSGLTDVYYAGTLEQWCNINFGDSSTNPCGCGADLYIGGVKQTDIVIPDSVTSIGNYAFYGCKGLTSVTIPDTVTSIGGSAFRGCSGLTGELMIPDSVTFIGSGAFYDCSGLTGELVIPDSIISIGGSAFRGCSALTSLDLGSVTSIGDYAFYGCSGLTGELVIPDSVTSIGNHAFHGCSGLTGERVIPDYVTSIGDSAFSGCSGLTGELIIPDSVTSIGDFTFWGCSGLTSLDLGSVTSIGDLAFSYCSGLARVTIHDSVTVIGAKAFTGCVSLSTINYAGTESAWSAITKGDDWDRETGVYTIKYNVPSDINVNLRLYANALNVLNGGAYFDAQYESLYSENFGWWSSLMYHFLTLDWGDMISSNDYYTDEELVEAIKQMLYDRSYPVDTSQIKVNYDTMKSLGGLLSMLEDGSDAIGMTMGEWEYRFAAILKEDGFGDLFGNLKTACNGFSGMMDKVGSGLDNFEFANLMIEEVVVMVTLQFQYDENMAVLELLIENETDPKVIEVYEKVKKELMAYYAGQATGVFHTWTTNREIKNKAVERLVDFAVEKSKNGFMKKTALSNPFYVAYEITCFLANEVFNGEKIYDAQDGIYRIHNTLELYIPSLNDAVEDYYNNPTPDNTNRLIAIAVIAANLRIQAADYCIDYVGNKVFNNNTDMFEMEKQSLEHALQNIKNIFAELS